MKMLSKLRSFRPGKTWIVLGVAVGIGAFAAFAARSYLTGEIHAIEARAKGKSSMAVVAKADIAKGIKLSSENVAIREIPSEFSHSGAVTPDEFERINGQALAYPIKGGEMILWSLLETQRAPTFSARVESGHRAMTVAVDEINSISGMIEPGDTIDLIVSQDQQGKKVTFPLLQSVLVMATGQRSVDDPKSGERRQYSTVTLETTPLQAQNLISARETGRLTALLRNPLDKQLLGKARNESVATVDGQSRMTHFVRTHREVPVIYGGRTGKISPDALRLENATREFQRSAGPEPGIGQPASSPVAFQPPVAARVLSR